ncbi:helix-turn-helix domain-containing protein [Streptomyces purpureus]|uniref:helix-turn-helix domain-containing protein n=1 Tax=Streptomyces purpureus TaxID=1951 RepID=UPI00048CEB4B|nr:helix-turn-helix domain-containing protein [Streptomyces purpureus]
MTDRFYSVEQVAERLGLHVRTVRNYVRDGRLAAVRIGKQYRIAHEDLEAFTGRPVPPARPVEEAGAEGAAGADAHRRHTDVTSVVEIDGVDSRTVHRLTSLLMATATGPRPGGSALRIETVYDEDRRRLKVVVLGGLTETALLFAYMDGVLDS